MQTFQAASHSTKKNESLASFTFPDSRPFPYPPLDDIADLKTQLPATAIINGSHHSTQTTLVSKDNLLFCYRALIRTIEACLEKRYTDFDAHTTANCCHGMALLVRDLILAVLELDLYQLQQEAAQKIQNLEKATVLNNQCLCELSVPGSLIDLTCLYVLAFIKEADPQRGGRTVTKKLKLISPVGTQFCDKIIRNLQKNFSSFVAIRYSHYLNKIKNGTRINGAPIEMWGQYVAPNNLKIDRNGIHYASNLFSMQVSLAHLILSKAKIAIVNDLISTTGKLRGRYTCLLEGDGQEHFTVLNDENIKLDQSYRNDPVVVFGGCVYSDQMDLDMLVNRTSRWLNHFPSLVLACDIFYPQFPSVMNDPEFDSQPLIPREQLLKEIIDVHSGIQGVSSSDPSLFCLAHIYPASVDQILRDEENEDKAILPTSYIPANKTSLNAENESILAANK